MSEGGAGFDVIDGFSLFFTTEAKDQDAIARMFAELIVPPVVDVPVTITFNVPALWDEIGTSADRSWSVTFPNYAAAVRYMRAQAKFQRRRVRYVPDWKIRAGKLAGRRWSIGKVGAAAARRTGSTLARRDRRAKRRRKRERRWQARYIQRALAVRLAPYAGAKVSDPTMRAIRDEVTGTFLAQLSAIPQRVEIETLVGADGTLHVRST